MNVPHSLSIASGAAAYSKFGNSASIVEASRSTGTGPGLANSDVSLQFESMTLSIMISSMLPKGSKGPFGAGSAGEMWKPLFAREIANVLSADGRLRLLSEATGGGARLRNEAAIQANPEADARSVGARASAFNSQFSTSIGEWLTTTQAGGGHGAE